MDTATSKVGEIDWCQIAARLLTMCDQDPVNCLAFVYKKARGIEILNTGSGF